MRHTLLPLNERKALRREYRVRVIIVALFLFSVAGMIGVASLFPAYVRARGEEKTQLDLAESLKQKQRSEGFTALEDNLRNDQKLLAQLNISKNPNVSEIASSIITLRQNIKLTSFTFTAVGTSSLNVDLVGVAPTRNDLRSFKERIEVSMPTAKVDLPIGELAKSANLEFTIKVSLKLP